MQFCKLQYCTADVNTCSTNCLMLTQQSSVKLESYHLDTGQAIFTATLFTFESSMVFYFKIIHLMLIPVSLWFFDKTSQTKLLSAHSSTAYQWYGEQTETILGSSLLAGLHWVTADHCSHWNSCKICLMISEGAKTKRTFKVRNWNDWRQEK